METEVFWRAGGVCPRDGCVRSGVEPIESVPLTLRAGLEWAVAGHGWVSPTMYHPSLVAHLIKPY